MLYSVFGHFFSGDYILVYLFSNQKIQSEKYPFHAFFRGNNNHSYFQNGKSSLIDNLTICERQTISDNMKHGYQSLRIPYP